MTKRVSAAHAKAHFSELVNGVAHGGQRVLIERHGKPVAALVSPDDLAKIEPPPAQLPPDDPLSGWIGAWGDVSEAEIDRIMEIIYANRERSITPPPDLRDGA